MFNQAWGGRLESFCIMELHKFRLWYSPFYEEDVRCKCGILHWNGVKYHDSDTTFLMMMVDVEALEDNTIGGFETTVYVLHDNYS